MLESNSAELQLWIVAVGSGLGTLCLRLVPLFASRAIAGEKARLFFDRAGYGILGGIVSSSAIKSSHAVFTGGGAIGPGIALVCVAIAFGLSLWRGGTILPTLLGLALFVGAGALYPG